MLPGFELESTSPCQTSQGARAFVAEVGRFSPWPPAHFGPEQIQDHSARQAEERGRLREVLRALAPEGGFIARTAGRGAPEASFRADATMLVEAWNGIRERAEQASAPAMVYGELDLLRRMLRDAPREGYDRIVVDNADSYERAMDYLSDLDPVMAAGVELHTGTEPLFQGVIRNAVSASAYDRRFAPVQPAELKDITVEVSVLSPLRMVNTHDEIQTLAETFNVMTASLRENIALREKAVEELAALNRTLEERPP